MAESTHRVEITRINNLKKHPYADTLFLAELEGLEGYSVIVKDGTWKIGDLGAYIPPDSLVPEGSYVLAGMSDLKPQDGFVRIRSKKIRGLYSAGLLIQCPPEIPPISLSIGMDVAHLLGVKHYDPPTSNMSLMGRDTKAPENAMPVYDVESFRKYGNRVFQPGEQVFVSEKVHGSNIRVCFRDGEIHVGSRTRWKNLDPTAMSAWWIAISKVKLLPSFLEITGLDLYGEIYGDVQDLKYGKSKGEVDVVFYDIRHPVGGFLDSSKAYDLALSYALPWVPIISRSLPFDFDQVLALADGMSLIPGSNHLREGVVVKPLAERWSPLCGRANLKIVSDAYLSRRSK